MRKTLLVLTLTGLTLWAGVSDAFARGRSGGGRGNSYSAGRGNAGRGNYGRGNYGRGNYGYGNGGYGYGGYGNYGYGGGYLPFGGAFLPNVYYGGQDYSPYYQGYDYAPGYAAPTTQSFYPPTAPAQQTVGMTIFLPVADAQVWIEHQAMTQTGMERTFESPPLAPNVNFTYTINARWMENGKTVNQQRQVGVQAGQNVSVNFRDNSPVNVPLTQVPGALPQN